MFKSKAFSKAFYWAFRHVDCRRLLRWIDRVACMSFTRAPRKNFVCWVENPQLIGRPQLNWVQILKKTLIENDLPSDFFNDSHRSELS
jgi:hypothetical protein